MNKVIYFLLFYFSLSLCVHGEAMQKGPYTVKLLAEGVYNIEDTNDSNPAGIVIGDDGQIVHMNNCSDMYLVVGSKKALLIDLSNEVTWDKTAAESLRSIVYERAGKRGLVITVTHKHGDHLGMLPAFKDDAKASFWIPEAEFKEMDIFPRNRTVFFPERASIDLGGGMVIKTMEVPGHTEHSTVFILKNKNFIFTGDAIGSGSGVWLFNKQSFYTYVKSIDDFIEYIEDPSGIDKEKMVIYGGHGWQRGKLKNLTAQYIYDMEALIERMGLGIAESEKMPAMIPFLDTNFKYGTAAISWNKDAANEYTEFAREGMGSFTLMLKQKDYGLALTRLILDLGKNSLITGKEISKNSFQVIDSNKSNNGVQNITGVSITDRQGYAVEAGRYVTIDLDYVMDPNSVKASYYIVTLNKDLGKYKKGSRFIQKGRTIRK